MNPDEIIQWIRNEKQKRRPIRLPEIFYDYIDGELAQKLIELFGSDTLIYLPDGEVRFFEWLKENDPEVWEDLWGGVEEEPYVVSLAFIPLIIKKFRGFPICDLMSNDNYYFTEAHIIQKTAHLLLEMLREKFLKREPLTVAQALLLEISAHPVDIWHFAYYHKISIQEAKKAVDELVEDNLIVHLKKAEDLADYVQFY